MARRKRRGRRSGKGTRSAQPQEVHPNAAGLDVGATSICAAVRAERAAQPIQSFPTFTCDLHALADWLSACQVDTVAMESTGVYWIPVYQILEARGFEVVLVNARHVRSVPGRKSDVEDCEWLRCLHSVGFLRGSFRPPDEVCAVRSLLRHRDSLVKTASRSVLHMQKAFDQMNVHLHHAISDLTGYSGLAITDAILDGEREPGTLGGAGPPTDQSQPYHLDQTPTVLVAPESQWTRRAIVATMVHMNDLTAREAKNRFGQLLDAAQRAPVRITRNGRAVTVMLSTQLYDQLRGSAWERLTATMDAMGEEASARGLTDAKLEALLADES